MKAFLKDSKRASLSAAFLFMASASCGPTGASLNDGPGHHEEELEPKQVGHTKPSAVELLTEGRTRVVWVQDLADGTDIGAASDTSILMGYDSHDGRGETTGPRQTGQLRQTAHHPYR